MNRVALALLGASVLAMTSGAQATVTVTPAPTPATLNVNATPTQGGMGAAITYNDLTPLVNFTDTIFFSNNLAGTYTIQGGTSSGNVFFNGAGEGITLIGPNGTLSNAFTLLSNGPFTNFFLGPLTLGAGDFTLQFVGHTMGTGGFAGTADISAVPEPSTWAFMLFGFAAMGFAVRRGRKQGLTQLA